MSRFFFRKFVTLASLKVPSGALGWQQLCVQYCTCAGTFWISQHSWSAKHENQNIFACDEGHRIATCFFLSLLMPLMIRLIPPYILRRGDNIFISSNSCLFSCLIFTYSVLVFFHPGFAKQRYWKKKIFQKIPSRKQKKIIFAFFSWGKWARCGREERGDKVFVLLLWEQFGREQLTGVGSKKHTWMGGHRENKQQSVKHFF